MWNAAVTAPLHVGWAIFRTQLESEIDYTPRCTRTIKKVLPYLKRLFSFDSATRFNLTPDGAHSERVCVCAGEWVCVCVLGNWVALFEQLIRPLICVVNRRNIYRLRSLSPTARCFASGGNNNWGWISWRRTSSNNISWQANGNGNCCCAFLTEVGRPFFILGETFALRSHCFSAPCRWIKQWIFNVCDAQQGDAHSQPTPPCGLQLPPRSHRKWALNKARTERWHLARATG